MKAALRFVLTVALPLPATSSVAQTPIHVLSNEAPGAWHRLEPAGDVDFDGRGDVIVSGVASVRVFSGLSGVPLFTFTDGAGDRWMSGDGAGDVDLDGHADLVVGAPADATTGEAVGALRIYSGTDGSVLLSAFGAVFPTAFGSDILRLGDHVAGPGDVTADGYPDAMATRRGFYGGPADAAHVYSGADGSLVYAFTDDEADSTFPHGDQTIRVSGAGDADQDGFVDMLVSFVPSPCNGTVWLRSGADGTLLRDLSELDLCAFGLGLAAAGDLDGDGVDDQLVGTSFAFWGEEHFGGVTVAFSGATGARLFVRDGASPYSGFGTATAVAGDVNVDGRLDVVAGDSFAGVKAMRAGTVAVFADGSGPRLACDLAGQVPRAYQGTAVAAPGDVDLDGADDIATLAAGIEVGPGSFGEATLWSLKDCGVAPTTFRPGSLLEGEITAADDVDEARFSALAGTKLKLTLATSGDLHPRIEITDANGKLVKAWTPKPGDKPQSKKIVLKQDGDYVLAVRGKAGTTGDWQLITSAKHAVGLTTWIDQKQKAPGSKPMQVQFRALAGAHMYACVEPLKNLADEPALVLSGPDGIIDILPFLSDSVSLNGETWVTGMLLPDTGSYTLAVADAPKGAKAAFQVEVLQPFGGEVLRVD